MKRSEIRSLISRAIQQYGNSRVGSLPVMADEDTILFGSRSILDGASLLNVVKVLE